MLIKISKNLKFTIYKKAPLCLQVADAGYLALFCVKPNSVQ